MEASMIDLAERIVAAARLREIAADKLALDEGDIGVMAAFNASCIGLNGAYRDFGEALGETSAL